MMTLGNILLYFIPIILGISLLIFWRRCTIRSFFPNRLHILLISISFFIPFFGLISFVTLFGFYIGGRLFGDIKIKKNKFSDFWLN